MTDIKIMPPNALRGTIGAIAIALVGIGAGLLWGVGGALLSVGIGIWIDLGSDEAIERITNTRRGL